MLVGAYPFEDQNDPKNIKKTIERITIREIKSEPWFLRNLPRELTETSQGLYYRRDSNAPNFSSQSIDEIMEILIEARTLLKPTRSLSVYGWPQDESKDEYDESNEEN
ncbi:hypothetical protein ZIOFF_050764 [Zingiber officinale]|uniref:Protein kinase domain-containing protein n=1 Tax=Zingiber officinale TaxID=94328 RepID=A0A8J5FKQ9_ZINOF|nr:hypothetical protein ZIOFF_050764 [Zingiber officinale]